MINIKSNTALKKKVQARAKRLGLPLSVVVNNYLQRFAAGEPVVFSEELIPNAKTAAQIREAEADYEKGVNYTGPMSPEEFIKHLETL